MKNMSIDVSRLLFVLLVSAATSKVSYSQPGKPNDIEAKFQQYQSYAFKEKLFLHVDKTCFFTGEVVWFKLYNVDAYLNKPLALSVIAYVEVIDREHRAVLQTKVGMTDGSGNGSLIIPSSLPSGNYIIRAYTSWMKNFGPEYFFEQQVSIINTLTDTTYSPPVVIQNYDVGFFPEGGNLVYGLESKIAFKAADQYGKAVACRGNIVNQKNDTIASFESTHLGMGSFMFTPVKDEQYTARVSVGDSVLTRKLQTPFDAGYVISVSDSSGGDKIKITVHTRNITTEPVVYLFAHTRQLVKKVQAGYLINGAAVFYIDKKAFGDGISHLTLFNSQKVPVCERLYFHAPSNEMHIEAKNGQDTYSTRKKVTLDLSTTDVAGRQLNANLSMSVFLIDSLQNMPGQNILNYLLLSSDINGKIESPQYYFGQGDPAVERDADNLMLTQGWSRFRWEDILQNKKPQFEFLPETEGFVISGKVIDKRTGNPLPSVGAFLSLPDTAFEMTAATSKVNGDVRFAMKKYFGNHEIIVQANYQTDSNYRVDIQSPFSDRFSSTMLPRLQLNENWQSQMLNRSINAQVENTYLFNQKNRIFRNEATDSTSFYGKPDLQYNLDDYTRFVTLEEVMREYVADVRIRKEGGKFYYRVRNDLFNTFFEDAPLLLIDGVPVFDPDKLIAFDPLKIKKIEVISRKYYIGSLITDGIVSYKTYDGDLAGFQLDPGAVVLQYNGLQQQREFYTPVYENAAQTESRVPDFRNVLMWLPEIKTDSTGKHQLSFYTSDVSGQFAVVIQGISDEGAPGSKTIFFRVVGK